MAGIIAYGIYSSNQASKDAVRGQEKAADATVEAAEKNIDFQKWLWGEQKDLAQPFADMGKNAIPQYQDELNKPVNVFEDPSYKFRLDEGAKAYENSGSAKGMSLSGSQAKALTRYGQDYASTEYNQAFNRKQVGLDNLYRMIMSGQAAAAGQAQTGTAMGSQVSNSINSIGNANNQKFQNIGNINAANSMAGYNSLLDVGNLFATFAGSAYKGG